ncbi:cobalt-zinc-cadmium resistance protein CzcA [Jejuia pallidilutea]|nr:cobalt-zinc-cadmium resistance protein CzcA [Jejuia pallidilutea]
MYYQYLYAVEKERIHKTLDSLYKKFANTAERRFELGETNYLEKITAKSKQRQVNLNFVKAIEDVQIAYSQLMSVVQTEDNLEIVTQPLKKEALQIVNVNESPEVSFFTNNVLVAKSTRQLEKQQLLPNITLNYFQGTNPGINKNLYGYQLGLKIPLFFMGTSSKIKALKIAETIAAERLQDYTIKINAKSKILVSQLNQQQKALNYYEQEGAALSKEILKTANSSFKNGEIDFYQYILSLENAYEIQLNYLENLNTYNQTVITINYLTL